MVVLTLGQDNRYDDLPTTTFTIARQTALVNPLKSRLGSGQLLPEHHKVVRKFAVCKMSLWKLEHPDNHLLHVA